MSAGRSTRRGSAYHPMPLAEIVVPRSMDSAREDEMRFLVAVAVGALVVVVSALVVALS